MAHRDIEIDWTAPTVAKVDVGDTVTIAGKRSGKFEFRFPDEVPFEETPEEKDGRRNLERRSPDGSTFTISPKARKQTFHFDCFLDGVKQPLQGNGAGKGNAQGQLGVGPDD